MQAVLRLLTGFAVGLFYRSQRLGEPLHEGPLLLVANHPNGLIDPVCLMQLTRRRVRLLAKEPLFRTPVLGQVMRAFGALPVYRQSDGADTAQNADTFAAVHEALGQGDLVCLFPEGTSHSEPELQKLKTGTARMALGAEAQAGFALGLAIQPVGLVYKEKGRFRSARTTWVGAAIRAADLAGAYARDEREAVRRLTARLDEGLREVTLNLDRHEDLPLLELAERAWSAADGRGRLERLHRMASAVRRLRAEQPERLAPIEADAQELHRRLDAAGLSARDLAKDVAAKPALAYAVREGTVLGVGLLPGALGTLLWWLPYRAAGLIAHRLRPEPEVEATAKLLASLVLFPTWWGLGLFAAARAGTDWAWGLALAAPLFGLFAVHFGDRLVTAFLDLRSYLRLSRGPDLRSDLEARRRELARAVEELAQDLPPPASEAREA